MKKLTLNEVLMESLKDPQEAAAYLDAVLEEKDIDAFLHALKTVAEAQGGMTAIARKTNLNRAGLYRMFTSEGNPSFRNITRVLGSLGYKIRFERQASSGGMKAGGQKRRLTRAGHKEPRA